MNQAEPLWHLALDRLEKRILKINYNAFILPLIPRELTDETLVLQGIDRLMCELVQSNYRKIIEETLVDICGQPLELQVIHVSESQTAHQQFPEDESLPTEYVSGFEQISHPRPSFTELDSAGYRDSFYNQLNPRYTMDRFVRGKSNELSHAAALAVIEAPARAYNPLFIYGDVGLGKTHLMHAIGHALLERFPHYKVAYTPFERFLNEFLQALQYKTTENFRNRYRDVDLLLVDDIQFIVGTKTTQDEFFHTFNSLYNMQKQIVISCDRPPREIQNLTDRIRSRFEAGLIVDIQRPDLETRLAILQSKARDEQIAVSTEVFSYIATRITSNIRELEGALMRLKAVAAVEGVTFITLDYAATALKKIIDPNKSMAISIELIQQVVSDFFNVTIEDLKAKKRSQDVTLPRQIAMYFCRELTDHSLPRIGDAFGGRDHTTVMHAVEKILDQRKIDVILNGQLNDLLRLIQA